MSLIDLLCGCCRHSSGKTEILLEETGNENLERKQYTVMFGACPKGTGVRVESTLQGPRITKIGSARWNKLNEADKILSINNENCVDCSPEMVQFLLVNLYEKTEAIFEIERGVETFKVGVRRDKGGFGFDFKKSSENPNYIVVNSVHTEQSNDLKIGDKILSINDIDAGMINADDLQSMLDTPGNKTKLVIERLVRPE
mmetsp:Transcript_54115/g.86619  ORF Transcript_54115/g.86619 Transcript_54115/m.86619 type:complete len:199 (-) Transcript_54115:213-809(-)|eukprot:CAMPEP_0197031230 /NCGR_PEP_ID=MMETSP1384-20130603/10297_1 /TAXON_ID=29189 /ORGANISM="Ammonia sp." /LENGTH=198 /DNA_ID=CAMNT_0042460733 /DNA_START=59 /DNA_END=655 /DNA_ORIENTATION=+